MLSIEKVISTQPEELSSHSSKWRCLCSSDHSTVVVSTIRAHKHNGTMQGRGRASSQWRNQEFRIGGPAE
jgi:hypothetical protein